MAVRQTVTWDGGSNGATITAGGDFASVQGSPTYTNDAKHGALAQRGSGTGASVRVTNTGTSTHSGSLYAKATGVSSSAVRFVQFNSPTNALIGSIRFHSDGHIDMANNSSVRLAASSLSWASDTWLRFDWEYDDSGSDPAVTLRIFTTVEGTTPAETVGPVTMPTAAAVGNWQFGATGGVAGQVVTADTFRVSDSIEWIGPFVPPQTVVPVGQPAETDTTAAATRQKVRTLGQATETDSPQPVALRRKTKTLGQATEADTAAAARPAHSRTVGQPAETDTAQPVAGRRKTKTLGQATETDSPQTATRRKAKGTGQTTEADTAQPADHRRVVVLGQAEESDIGLPIGPPPPSTETYFNDVFPAAGSGGSRDLTGSGDSTKYAMGAHYRPAVDGTVTGVRWFVPTGFAPSNTDFAVGLVKVDPVTGKNGTVTWLDWNTGVTRPGAGDQGTWVTLPLSAPVDVLAGDELYAVVRTDRYGFAGQVFASGFGNGVPNASGDLLTDQNSGPYPNGAFTSNSGDVNPNPPNWNSGIGGFNNTFYGVDLVFTAVGAPITFQVGQPTETDTAQPVTRRKLRAVGQPAETETPQPVAARVKVRTLGQATETDTGQPVALRKTKTLGQPAETDTTAATIRRKTKTVGQPAETDTTQPLVPRTVIGLGQATEADTAQTLTRKRKTKTLGQATETDTAGSARRVGTVVHSWAGAPATGGFRVRAHLLNATSTRLAVSTSPTMSSPVFTAAQAPDGVGYVDHTVTGLADDTQHYYQLADTPTGGGESLTGPVGQARTMPSGAADFTFAFGACDTNASSDPAAFDDLRAWDPHFAIHMGDFHYRNPTSTDTDFHRQLMENQIRDAAGLAAALREVAWVYVRSDHDAGPGDNADHSTEAPASIAAYQQIVPSPPLVDVRSPKHGLYYAFTVGRVRFIAIDIRNIDRSPGLDAQTSSKTMLGATQLAWLLGELDRDEEPVKVIISDVAWLGAASTTNGEDKWWSYDNERQAIGNHISSNGIQVLLLHGDSHTLGYADGTGNPFGGFPVWCSALFHQAGGGRNLGTFDDLFNNSGGACRAYGRATVTDDGDSITIGFSGWDAEADVERIATSVTFDASPPITATTGQPTETDTAQPVGRRKVRLLGQATEADTGQAATRQKAKLLTEPSETDTGQTATRQKDRLLGQPAETDTGQAVGRRKTRTLGQPAETDTATAVTPTRLRLLGQPAETDTGQAAGRAKVVTLGQATETDTAQTAGPTRLRLLGQPAETDTGQATGSRKTRLLGVAGEIDTAPPMVVAGKTFVPTGQAVETDDPQPAGTVKRKTLGQALEADTGQPVTAARTLLLGQPAEADAGQAVARRKTRLLGQALEVDAAFPASHPGQLGVAAETDEAQPAHRVKLRLLGQAAETDTALPVGAETAETAWTFWNGTAETTAQATWWNGLAEAPFTVELAS